ncbi:MAG TPA: hypothetical protein VK982_08680 [Bacteroidales bacterium]|nr:hypothetical protein [Bacteroidales bacterium]
MFRITNINIETETMHADNEVVDIAIVGYDVEFQVGEMVASVMIFTNNRILTIDEIKERVQAIIDNYLQNKGD